MKRIFNWRINLILGLFLISGAVVAGRLFNVQILDRKLYSSQAMGQQINFADISGERGKIFFSSSKDSKGNINSQEFKSLAVNKDVWLLGANPKEIDNKEFSAMEISKILNLDEKNGSAKYLPLINSSKNYVVIEKGLDSSQAEKIKSLNLKGIFLEKEKKRFYPQGQMASHILGFVGGEGSGQYGIEGYYEDLLKGKKGFREKRKGIESLFTNSNENEPMGGADIYLTIDPNIQFQAESLLVQEKNKSDIDSGQIIIMKPDTGKILAMAVYPFFDPNDYSKYSNFEIFQNSALQKLFEPGSVIKPFTMLIALNEGKISPDTVYTDNGFVKIGKDTISNYNYSKNGEQTMTQVLEKSLNTGAVFVQQKVEKSVFWDYLNKFGFFQKTKIDSQGEVFSKNELLKSGPGFNYATASFGQGIEMTPIQLAKAFSALANGGKMVKPYLVEKIVEHSSSGSQEMHTNPEVSAPIASSNALSQLNSMLVSVVENGIPKVAKIPGYYLAGKTGTAQIPLKNGRGYEPDSETIQTFVGYGPAYSPEFLILVKLDRPKVPTSSLSAVPIFKELAQYLISYWQIPPDYDAEAKE